MHSFILFQNLICEYPANTKKKKRNAEKMNYFYVYMYVYTLLNMATKTCFIFGFNFLIFEFFKMKKFFPNQNKKSNSH